MGDFFKFLWSFQNVRNELQGRRNQVGKGAIADFDINRRNTFHSKGHYYLPPKFLDLPTVFKNWMMCEIKWQSPITHWFKVKKIAKK